MNAVSMGIGDELKKDKITFKDSLKEIEYTMKRLLDLLEDVTEIEQVDNEITSTNGYESEKQETAQ